jgi:uncharacterized protein YuzE
VKGTYDPSVDAAYIYIADEIGEGQVAKTVPLDPAAINGEINLDFDDAGRLIGIEVLGASKRLPETLISRLARLG